MSEIEASTRSLGIAAQVLYTRAAADIEPFDASILRESRRTVVGSKRSMQPTNALS